MPQLQQPQGRGRPVHPMQKGGCSKPQRKQRPGPIVPKILPTRVQKPRGQIIPQRGQRQEGQQECGFGMKGMCSKNEKCKELVPWAAALIFIGALCIILGAVSMTFVESSLDTSSGVWFGVLTVVLGIIILIGSRIGSDCLIKTGTIMALLLGALSVYLVYISISQSLVEQKKEVEVIDICKEKNLPDELTSMCKEYIDASGSVKSGKVITDMILAALTFGNMIVLLAISVIGFQCWCCPGAPPLCAKQCCQNGECLFCGPVGGCCGCNFCEFDICDAGCGTNACCKADGGCCTIDDTCCGGNGLCGCAEICGDMGICVDGCCECGPIQCDNWCGDCGGCGDCGNCGDCCQDYCSDEESYSDESYQQTEVLNPVVLEQSNDLEEIVARQIVLNSEKYGPNVTVLPPILRDAIVVNSSDEPVIVDMRSMYDGGALVHPGCDIKLEDIDSPEVKDILEKLYKEFGPTTDILSNAHALAVEYEENCVRYKT